MFLRPLESKTQTINSNHRCPHSPRRYLRVKAPRSWPRQHHDGQPNAVQRFKDVEQVTEPVGAIDWLPRTYPFDGVKHNGPGTNREHPKRREHGQ
jgi:hypothetical protein